VAPKKKVKRSLKKKTFKSSKVLKSAIDRIEKTVEQTRPAPLKEAFERLEQEVEEREAVNHLEPEVTKDESGLSARLPAGSGVSIKKTLELINIYRVEIAYRVQKSWAFSGQLAGDAENLQASLVFKVMPNGEIKDIFFTDRSGNSYLDESAYKAIVKSNPVDPHPEGISKPYVNVGLRFTPEGVR
jgi:colicin import membrane protein